MVAADPPQVAPLDWPMPGHDPAGTRILVLDDQEIVRLQLKRILQKSGFAVQEAGDASAALHLLETEAIDLVLSDIRMPGTTGLDFVKSMAHRIPETAVLMVSGLDSVEMALDCLKHGAYGYVLKPFQTNGILIAVANALRRRMLELEHRDREQILAARVREQTFEIRSSREEIAFRLLTASEHRDNETGAHVRRIGLYTAHMAALLGWSLEGLECVTSASQMHDIGKIGVPDRILQKHGALTDEEWIIMKTHTTMGANILKDSQVPFIGMGARIAASHHEKWDGSGYPLGLKAEAIPLEARITTLVDVFDALSSPRVYKRAWSQEEVLDYVREQAGRHFDPSLCALFLEHHATFQRIFAEHPDQFAPEELPR